MRLAAVFLITAALLCAPALADEVYDEQYELSGAAEVEEAVPDSARELLGEADMEAAAQPEGMLARLAEAALEALRSQLAGAAVSAAKLAAVAVLCAAAGTVCTGGARRYVELAGCLAVAALAFNDAGALLSGGSEAIEELNSFSRALLPCLAATTAAGGMAGAAAAKLAATSLFMDVLITLSRVALLPLAYALLAVKTAASALDNPALESAGRLIKWLAVTAAAAVMTAFTLWLSLSGALAGAADAAASRAAKTAISAALPVVGGIISDAASTLVAGAGLLRSAVGVLGAVVILAVCLTPFLSLGLRYLLYKAAAVLASAFSAGRVSALIGELGGVFGLVLGVTGACAAMLFVSILSFVKAVGL